MGLTPGVGRPFISIERSLPDHLGSSRWNVIPRPQFTNLSEKLIIKPSSLEHIRPRYFFFHSHIASSLGNLKLLVKMFLISPLHTILHSIFSLDVGDGTQERNNSKRVFVTNKVVSLNENGMYCFPCAPAGFKVLIYCYTGCFILTKKKSPQPFSIIRLH
jgi:hypothetical protein